MSAILPVRGPERFVPVEGRVDRRQLGALLRLLTAQMVRRGTDASSGMKGHPLLQTLYSMGFLGLLAAGAAFRPTTLDAFLARTFASALVIVALMITAESDDVRMRRAEILLTKPISGATHLASVAAILFLTAGLISGSFALLPLLAAVLRLGLPPLLVPVLLLTLVAGAFALVLVWVLLLRLGVSRLGADRVRMATQVSIVLLIGLLTWSSLAGVAGSSLSPPTLSNEILDALPSTWLARFWTDGWSADANLRRAALVAVFGLCLAAFVRYGQRASADSIFETTTRARPLRAPLAARALGWLSRQPGLCVLVPPPVAALAGAILTLGRREEASRVRGFVTTVLALGIGVWGILGDGGIIPVAILSSVVLSVALEGLAATRQSASAPAAWAIAKSPLTAGHLVRAVLLAVLSRFVLVPLALFAVLLFRRHDALLATFLALASLFTTRIVVLGALAFRPSFPLDEAPVVTGVLGQVIAWAVGTAGAIAYAVAATLVSMLGTVGMVITALGTLGLAAAAWVARWGAARRVARLEHLG